MPLEAPQRYITDFTVLRPDRGSIVLYDTAIAALESVIEAIDRDDIMGRCRGVYAATEAVTSLYLHLDVRRFGEFADDLADLYGHILGCLVGINFYNDPSIAQDAIELLYPLRDRKSIADGMISAYKPIEMPSTVTEGMKPECSVDRAR
jgi:flagellin-specific chaperone FliS